MATNFKPCLVASCNGNSHCKGYCSAHYQRFRKHGDPLAGRRTSMGEAQRFFEEVVLRYEGDECLSWPYSNNGYGYGAMTVAGKMATVHRVLCEEVNGPPPTLDHQAAHSCGRGHLGCVTKRHLSWKTRKENMADKLIHGTHSRGEKHGKAKLTEPQVKEILDLKGKHSQREIARRYGVSRESIACIHRSRSWGWLQH